MTEPLSDGWESKLCLRCGRLVHFRTEWKKRPSFCRSCRVASIVDLEKLLHSFANSEIAEAYSVEQRRRLAMTMKKHAGDAEALALAIAADRWMASVALERAKARGIPPKPYVPAGMEACSKCGIPLSPSKIDGHMRRVHGEGLTPCPDCGAMIRMDRLEMHRQKLHSPEAKERAEKKAARKAAEERKALFSGAANSEGRKALTALAAGSSLHVSLERVERCSFCHAKVVSLNMGARRFKAFDVDSRGCVVGTHACDGERKGISVKAISAGIVDSNRRRH